ncbi:MAG: hypothetical protein A2174_00800 [Candidatus Portnoybacteria bacterium RBG_13_41_18]|uniref:Uncharacterized protein n=1 Tax=Candidatus Portnoybacteria bacterium RBG_13_41_18 TaxID=1801991 RepID=A0A1G2F947_9BACT|nr:MAG: hypothetical protein A2174_00800 [Candidatus Portnoybacteria bacterium RBG_13_41_18]
MVAKIDCVDHLIAGNVRQVMGTVFTTNGFHISMKDNFASLGSYPQRIEVLQCLKKKYHIRFPAKILAIFLSDSVLVEEIIQFVERNS